MIRRFDEMKPHEVSKPRGQTSSAWSASHLGHGGAFEKTPRPRSGYFDVVVGAVAGAVVDAFATRDVAQ